jgi:predicted metal-dependent peptidase
MKGGGGTDMGAGIEAAMEERIKPDVLIVITDGMTSWPENPPKAKLICCMVNEEAEGPGYAKTINIPPTKKAEARPW